MTEIAIRDRRSHFIVPVKEKKTRTLCCQGEEEDYTLAIKFLIRAGSEENSSTLLNLRLHFTFS